MSLLCSDGLSATFAWFDFEVSELLSLSCGKIKFFHEACVFTCITNSILIKDNM